MMTSQVRISVRSGLVAIMFCLVGCGHGNDLANSSPNRDTNESSAIAQQSSLPVIELDLFSRDELFAAGGGGCGMTLLPQSGELTNVSNPAGMLLFHGIDSPMLMKINQRIEEFELEESQGEEFYGQKTQQTFRNEALNLIVDIQVSIGEPGEIESITIPNATVTLKRENGGESQDVDAIAVFGDAGC